MLRIKLVKSIIGNTPRNRATVAALGLRKTNSVVEQDDTPAIRGMIHHVKHMLEVTEHAGEAQKKQSPYERPKDRNAKAKAPVVKKAQPKAVAVKAAPIEAKPAKAEAKPAVAAKPAAAKPAAAKPAVAKPAAAKPATKPTASEPAAKKSDKK